MERPTAQVERFSMVSQVVANLSFEGMIVPDEEREMLKKW